MQGFNMGRYVPPEQEGVVSANKLAGKHGLGNRGRKSGLGILTVRFEMPFAVWCENCPKETIIGQGVRFNAEKKKIGNYFSTPIWSFRMKHADCGGWIEIITDPKNTDYVVAEGGKKRETGEDKVLDGDIEYLTPEERERKRQDAFAHFERTIEHRGPIKSENAHIEELLEVQDKDWDDTYAANQRMRKLFRAERKVRERAREQTEKLQNTMGLGFDILAETEEDRRKAALVEFGSKGEASIIRDIHTRSIFGNEAPPVKTTRPPRKVVPLVRADEPKKTLQKELASNTRAAVDPFLSSKSSSTTLIPGLKRKRSAISSDLKNEENIINNKLQMTSRGTGLVDYGDEESD